MIHVSTVDYTKLYFMQAVDVVTQIASPFHKFNITYFGFTRLNSACEELVLTSKAGTERIWHEGKFYNYLFCDDISKYFDTNILWTQLIDNNMHAADFFNQLSETENIANGIVLVRKYENYVDFFHFASTRSNKHIGIFCLNNLDILETFIPYFYEKADNLIKEAEKDRVQVSSCMDQTLLTTKLFDKLSINMRGENKNFLLDLYNFTERERQCIKLIAKGLRTKEVARELDISYRTVEKYLQSMRYKTNSSTLCELIKIISNV